jgi:hypothetical protein
MKKILFLLVINVLIGSCSKELTYDPPFEGERLVVNGYILKNEILLKITHSVKPVRDYSIDENLAVNGAIVTLFENDVAIGTLNEDGNGYYSLQFEDDARPTAGYRYKIKAYQNKFGEVSSESVVFPEQPDINILSFEEAGVHNHAYSGLLSVQIPDLSTSQAYLSISAVNDMGNTLYIYRYPRSDANIYFENCEAFVGHTLIYSNSCGLSNTIMKFIVPLQSHLNSPLYDSVTINIGLSSKEIYTYAKSYNDLSGLLYGFSEPPILYTNIIEGYGLFYAMNTFEYVVDSKKGAILAR